MKYNVSVEDRQCCLLTTGIFYYGNHSHLNVKDEIHGEVSKETKFAKGGNYFQNITFDIGHKFVYDDCSKNQNAKKKSSSSTEFKSKLFDILMVCLGVFFLKG